MTRPQPRYKPGDKIGGRYQVHKALMGGMGEVCLCLDLKENYPYALKTFQQRYQSAALRKAFEQEVATWVALEKHPNIVRCFDMSILDNQPFMRLEWIAGEEGKGADLRGWLRHGPLDLKMALEITIDVVHGLIHAQEKQPGLVHRDLKPENILVAQGGLAKITDFGLAQIVEQAGLEFTEAEAKAGGRQSLVRKGGIAGTPAYMAPEQWRGESLDERTDIYAVGCILYELLTGRWPFRVDFSPTTPQQFQQWLSAMQRGHETGRRPVLPSALPDELNELIGTCLSQVRTDRPASLAILAEGLSTLYQQQFDQSPPARPPTTAFTAADYNNRGMTYANLKRYEAALADYGRAIELDPRLAQVYSNRGTSYADLQQYEAALADYGRAIELDPRLVQVYSNRGTTYKALQQYEAALADFGRAIELDPDDAPAYSNRGLAYHDLQQYEAALADFGRAIELDPRLAQAYYNRGNTYKALQQYEAALADYGRAIELDSDDAKAYSNRGTTYKALQQYEAALADFGRAIELDPRLAQVYSNRGNTYDALQQYEAALADFGRAIELDPRLAKAYSNRGTTYKALQQYEAALADYGRAIELDPDDAKAYSNRGTTYKALQQYEAALADYGRAIELDPRLAQAYYNRGNTYKALQRSEAALADFGRAIELDPDDANAYINRGNTYDVLQQYEAALADYRRAIELDPDDANAYVNRGATYNALQQYEAALADYRRAIELDPSYATAYLNLGALFGNQGQLREALPYFEKAAQLGDPTGAQYVAQVKQMLGETLPGLQVDPSQQAFEAFQQADSAAMIRQAVAKFPFIVQANFITAIEQTIAQQLPPEQRPHFEQRLGWLRQIAQEQNQ